MPDGLNQPRTIGVNPEMQMATVQSEAVKRPAGGRERSLANLKPFKPGQSGNPTGMSKNAAKVIKTAEDHVADAIEVLAKALKDKDSKVRIAAANAILDRGMGKPKQSIEMSRIARTLDEIATDDLIAAVQQSSDSDGTAETEASD
jgi:hypothetical protein